MTETVDAPGEVDDVDPVPGVTVSQEPPVIVLADAENVAETGELLLTVTVCGAGAVPPTVDSNRSPAGSGSGMARLVAAATFKITR